MNHSHRAWVERLLANSRRLLNVTVVLTLFAFVAHAQTNPTNKSTDESATQTSSPAPAVATESADSQEKAATDEGKAPDRIASLRSRIKEAKTDAERARLERLLIDYLVALNRKSEAIEELRAMSREDRVDPIGFYNLGNALARLGDTDTAVDVYRKAIKQRHGNYSHALNNLGVVLLRQGRWDEAAEALQPALKLENFHYGEASYNLGRLYAARGEADLAMREWTRTLQVQPDHSDAAIALARALAEDGSPERGLAVLDAFLARHSSNAEVAEARREILFNGGGNESAGANESGASATEQVEGAKSDRSKTSSAKG
ncbi:MAG: tetratricopeptide repeat protein, partial [Acidobacteriota bacterium]|nr:tetratricopeptide repeat protein [Acidobacteriota bacterium]